MWYLVELEQCLYYRVFLVIHMIELIVLLLTGCVCVCVFKISVLGPIEELYGRGADRDK